MLFLSTRRSQSDTSQSFSAELDAVYRLYCREYELQLQLQQQQLELQKQQLQLQQQLQHLEFFQQRQQQQPTSAIEKMVRIIGGPDVTRRMVCHSLLDKEIML